MGSLTRTCVLAAMLGLGVLATARCGSDDESESCPGITCSDCSGSGDCDVTCAPGQRQFCIAHPSDANLRCAYCQ
jgi:hypothetical protein